MTSASQTGKKKSSKKLVIVESPAKARTIEQYLGKDYTVRASIGHVRDLLRSRLSVDVDNNFEPEYRVPNDKRATVKELKAAVAKASEVYLATDPDREGEAIAWHLVAATGIDESRAHRVAFYEVTKAGILEAFAHPRRIDGNLVNAQQARRILDRLVGYKLSPLLWDRVRSGLSAGRVQSVAVRLVVEREREIEAFIPEEYWTIDAELARQAERADPDRLSFLARLIRIRGEPANLPNEEAVRPILDDLKAAAYTVEEVSKGQRKRKPAPPFITSTLQQEASRRLGFAAKKTMQLAQELYEGIALEGGEQIGLITYMRTDSPTVSTQAQQEARAYVEEVFGKDYLPPRPPQYRAKAKGAQEAHEAIRPTSVLRTPDSLRGVLKRDQLRLYQLIWQRFLASQMADAIYDTIQVNVMAGPPETPLSKRPYLFRVATSILRFPGFLAVYENGVDEGAPEDERPEIPLPDLAVGDELDLLQLLPEQHFTQPPSRYTEASLVKALEEYGIGRPSTYAPILSTIQQRGYVIREDRRLLPTETGIIVNDLLVEHFPDIVDVGFTARMEDNLDLIASGEREWVPILREFYGPFQEELARAQQAMPKASVGDEAIDRDCPDCGKPLVIRWGRYGKFIGCSNYPTCRHTEPLLEKIGVSCPLDGGDLIERRTRKGRTFYGCSNYPNCEWTSWKRPVPQTCPACGGLMVEHNKKWADCTQCGGRVPREGGDAEAE